MIIKVEYEITQEDLEDLFVTALEGGINGWCYQVKLKWHREEGYLSHRIAAAIMSGENFEVHFYDSETQEIYKISSAAQVQEGLEKFFAWSSYPAHLLLGEDANCLDADQADAAIQFILFGKIEF